MVLAIYGAGGLGREVLELARIVQERENRWEKIFFCDDVVADGEFVDGAPSYTFETIKKEYANTEIEFAVGVGEPFVRKALREKIENAGYELCLPIIHPNTQIASNCTLDRGVLIQTYSYVSVGAHVKKNAYLQDYTTMGHDAVFGQDSIISHGSSLMGCSEVGDCTYMAINVSMRDHVKIGSGVIVGMGTLITKDIPDDIVVVGQPARKLRDNTTHRVFK